MKITERYTIEKTDDYEDCINTMIRTEENAFVFYIEDADLDYYDSRDEIEEWFISNILDNKEWHDYPVCTIQGISVDYCSVIDIAKQLILGLKLR